MKNGAKARVKMLDVAHCLRIWRLEHTHWRPGQGWGPVVACTCVESRGEILVLDALAPTPGRYRCAEAAGRAAAERGGGLEARSCSRHGCVHPPLWRARVRAASLFRWDIPETELEFIEPGSQLPGGWWALYDGRGRNETPLWLPEQRVIVFAHALTAPGGELLVWKSPSHEKRALPALRALLELPFEQVIASHGQPVHSSAEYERVLTRAPWTG